MTEKTNETYFICTKQFEGKITDFVGPVFEDEIAEIKETEFEGVETNVLDEKIFKSLYPEEYFNDFNHNWIDYLSAKIESLKISYEIYELEIIIENNEEIYAEIINIPNFGSISRHLDLIEFSIAVDANPHLVALIVFEISRYCQDLFEIEIAQPIYADLNHNLHFNENAYKNYELDKFKNISLN